MKPIQSPSLSSSPPPKLTFFGNAKSEHLAYSAWNYRELPYITNNQAGNMVVDTAGLSVFVSNKKFAEARNSATYYSDAHRAYFLQTVS